MRPLQNKGPDGVVWFDRLPRGDLGEVVPPLWLRRAVVAELGGLEARFGPIVRTEQVINAPLGCGSFGCVFALADGRVLKVTSDEDEGPASERIRQLQVARHEIDGRSILAGTAKIDAVFRFRTKHRVYGEPGPIYGIVRERVGEAGEDIPLELGNALDFYTDGWDAWAAAEGEPGQVLGVAMARAGLAFLDAGGAEQRWMGALLAALWRDGYPLMDSHQCNVARRLASVGPGSEAGQVVIFDFGGSASCPLGHFVHLGNVVNRGQRPPVEIGIL